MNNNNTTKKEDKQKIVNALMKFLSVLLSLIFVFSALGAVAISGVRNFFLKGKFEKIVNEVNLEEVKFTVNGTVYNVSDYVYDAVSDLMPYTIPDFDKGLGAAIGGLINNAIKGIISSDTVDAIVKSTMIDCVSYYLNSDAKAAQKRIKANDSDYAKSPDYENAKNIEDAARIYVRSFIINAVENTAGINSDQIIVLLSKSTRNLLTVAAIVSAILIVLCNLSSVFDILVFFGGSSLLSGIIIKVMQFKFENVQEDKTLIGYQMLKPLVNGFSLNAILGIIIGLVLLGVFAALVLKMKPKTENVENT